MCESNTEGERVRVEGITLFPYIEKYVLLRNVLFCIDDISMLSDSTFRHVSIRRIYEGEYNMYTLLPYRKKVRYDCRKVEATKHYEENSSL